MSKPKTCGYCGQAYNEDQNHPRACRHHPQFYFPYDIDKDGIHQKGWQCCDSIDTDEPGCTFSAHRCDIRKVYRKNSIAFDYEQIDELADLRIERLEQARERKKKALGEDVIAAVAMEAVRSLVGGGVSRMVAKLGQPHELVGITNGTSGWCSRSYELFYRWEGLCFVASTNSVLSPYPEWTDDEYKVTGVRFFADEDEQEEFRAGMVTALTSD